MDLGQHYLEIVRFEFGRLKRLGEQAMAQIPDDSGFQLELDDQSNSIAVIVQHLSGNMLSRWTDFLTTDGEKPDRHRDREFEVEADRTRSDLMKAWERGWAALLESVHALTPADLEKTVTIRGESHTVPEAVQRQISHVSYHIGQLVYLARHVSGSSWKSLSIPKGESDRVAGGYKKL